MIALLILGAGALIAGADLPPGHPGVAGGAPTMGAPPGIVVDVVAHSPAGRRLPAAGAEVRLEQLQRGMMDEDSAGNLERVWIATADGNGRATFVGIPELSPGRSLRVVARWEGVEWPSELSQNGQAQIDVFAVTADRSLVRAAMAYSLNVSEDEIFIEQTMRLTPGDDPRAIDVDREGGIRLPMLEHAVFGESLDIGWIPPRPDPNMTLFEVDPPLGRLSVERGAMVYRGLIPPDGVTLHATYPAPYVNESNHTLAMRSPVELDSLELSVALGHDLEPEVALRTPFETIVRPTGDGERRLLRPLELPKAGEVFFVDVGDMPSRIVLLRPLVIGLSALVVASLTLAFLRTRRRVDSDATRAERGHPLK
ncbi:MAG: hypothetical protein U1F43_35360 [Myxococcota bacterium]